MLLLLAAFAWARPTCPGPDPLSPLDSDTAPDGAEYVLVADREQVCWWVVDALGTPRLAKRWDRAGRHPLRVEALADGRAALIMDDLRVQVRNVDDAHYRNLDLHVSGEPEVVLAHGQRDWLAVSVARDADTVLVEVLDLDRERRLASVALPARDLAMSFHDGDQVLWLDGAHSLALTEAGLSVRGQSPR